MSLMSPDIAMRFGDFFLAAATSDNMLFGMDLSIESLRSQQYSYYIFGFLVASLIVFSYIIYLYLPKNNGRLKKGERVMVGAIAMGVVIAVIFGWLQLIEGYLV